MKTSETSLLGSRMNWLNLDLGALRFILNSLTESIPLVPVNFQVFDDAFKFVTKDDEPGNLIYVSERLYIGEVEAFSREGTFSCTW